MSTSLYSVLRISSENQIPDSVRLIQGASGFKGRAVGVNTSRRDSSTVGIMLGGLIKGKLKEGLILIGAKLGKENSTA